MKVQVLGSGCPTCKRLYEMTQKAMTEMGKTDQVEYLTGADGMQKIIELGAMSSPILAVNDQIAMTGFSPDIEKVKTSIRKFDQ
jgi:glutaredoxin